MSWGRSKVTRCFIHPPSQPVRLYQGKVGEEAKWLGVLSTHPVNQYGYIRAKLGKKQSDSVFYPPTQSTSTVISGQSWGRSKVTRCFIHPPSQPVRLYQGKVGEEAKWLGVLSTHPVNQYGYIRAKLGKKQSDSVFYPPTQSHAGWVGVLSTHPVNQYGYIRAKLGKKQSDSVFYPSTQSTSTVISGQSWGRSKVTRCFIHPVNQCQGSKVTVFYPPTQSTSTVQSWGRSKVTRCFIHPPSQPVRLYQGKVGEEAKWLGVLSTHPVNQYGYIRAKLGKKQRTRCFIHPRVRLYQGMGKKQSDSVFYSTQSTSTVISGQSWGRSKVTRCFIHPPSQPVRSTSTVISGQSWGRSKVTRCFIHPPSQPVRSTSTVISGQSWGRSKVTRCFIHPPSQPVRLYIRAKLGKKQSDSVFYPPTQSTSTVIYQGKVGEEAKWLGVLSTHPVNQYGYISGQSWGRSKVTRCFIHPPSQPVRLYIRAKLGKKQSDSVFYPPTQSTSTVIYQGKVGEEAKWLGVLSTHPVNQDGYIRAKLGKKQSDLVFYPPTQSTRTVISGQSWGRSKVTWCFIHPVNQYSYIRAKLGKKQSDLVFYPPSQPVQLYQGKVGEEAKWLGVLSTQSTSTVISGQSWGRSKVTWCFIHPVNQYSYIRAKLGKKGKCLITMLVRSGLQHDQKNMWGVVYCTTERAHEEWFTVLPKDLC